MRKHWSELTITDIYYGSKSWPDNDNEPTLESVVARW